MDIIDHWTPLYYAHVAFVLGRSYLLNVDFRYFSDLLNQYTFLLENKSTVSW